MTDPGSDPVAALKALQEALKETSASLALLKRSFHIQDFAKKSQERKRLLKLATGHCKNPTVLQWLKDNSESGTFSKLVDMFDFLKRHIDEEEKKKNHSDAVDITFLAHGAIRDFLIPASCLLPLSSIRDVVLYTPWNCVSAGLAYWIASGKLEPQHRIFYCTNRKGCKRPAGAHRPKDLPDRWNSMSRAGDQLIPNISVSPLRPNDGIWKNFQSLCQEHGPLGANRIVIPFILPGLEWQTVPFSVVTLALDLVLLQSRFKATVHLDTCLRDQSTGQRFDRKYLEEQYAWTPEDTGTICSPDIFKSSLFDSIRRNEDLD